MNDSAYIPGTCNINTKEVAYRRKAMWFGIVLSVMFVIGLMLLHAPWWISPIVLFVPVFIAAINHLQVRNKFCVSYGSSGRQNADEDSAHAYEVLEENALKADRAKTKQMNLQALGITLFIIVLAAGLLYIASQI